MLWMPPAANCSGAIRQTGKFTLRRLWPQVWSTSVPGMDTSTRWMPRAGNCAGVSGQAFLSIRPQPLARASYTSARGDTDMLDHTEYGHVYALDAASGEMLWRFDAEGRVLSSPALAGGVVYIGSNDGRVYALDTANGVERWRYQTDDVVDSSPTVDGGAVYVGSADGHVYALDAANGDQIWRYQTGHSVDSSPTVADGTLYVGSFDHHVYALDAANGALRWTYRTGAAVFSSPAVVEGVVYIGSDDGSFYALSTDVSPAMSTMPRLEAAQPATEPITTRQVRRARPRLRWQTETYQTSSSLTVADGIVYWGDEDDYVHAAEAATGKQLWRFNTGFWVLSTPVVADGLVFFGADENLVYALDAVTGETRWRYETGDSVRRATPRGRRRCGLHRL